MSSVAAKLARGALWIAGARLIANILSVAGTLLMARLLMPADFGLVSLGWAILFVVGAFTDISVGAVLIQHANPTREHVDTAFTLNALRAAAVAILLVAVAGPLGQAFHEDRLPEVLVGLALVSLISGLGSPRSVLLTRDLQFWQQFLIEVARRISGLAVSVAAALTLRNYWALVAGSIATEIAGLLVSYLVAPYRPRVDLRHWREMFSYTIWLTLAQAINTINWRFDQLMIGMFLGKLPLGYYSVGDNLAALPTREAIAPLTNALFPAFAQIRNRPGGDLVRAYQSAQALLTMIALPVGVGLALIADPLVRLALTDKWLPAAIVISALSSVYALQTLGSLAQALAMATGDTRLLFKRDVQSFLLRVPSVAIGMWLGGIAGVAVARAVAGVLGIFFNLRVVRELTGLGYAAQLAPSLRSLASVGVMAAAVLACRSLTPFATDAPGLVTEIICLILLGAITYVGTQLLTWVLARYPAGPESQIFSLCERLLRGWRRSAGSA